MRSDVHPSPLSSGVSIMEHNLRSKNFDERVIEAGRKQKKRGSGGRRLDRGVKGLSHSDKAASSQGIDSKQPIKKCSKRRGDY